MSLPRNKFYINNTIKKYNSIFRPNQFSDQHIPSPRLGLKNTPKLNTYIIFDEQMSETGAGAVLTKRIVFIGDEKVGKTMLINAFQESNPSCCLPSEKVNDVSKNDETKKDTPVPSQKQPSKDSEEESDEDSSVVDPALAAEIEAMVLHATMRHEGCVYQIDMLEASSDIAVMKKQRSAVYAHADVVVVMYSIDSVKSFRNASKKWRSHVKKFLKSETCPIFLVGKFEGGASGVKGKMGLLFEVGQLNWRILNTVHNLPV